MVVFSSALLFTLLTFFLSSALLHPGTLVPSRLTFSSPTCRGTGVPPPPTTGPSLRFRTSGRVTPVSCLSRSRVYDFNGSSPVSDDLSLSSLISGGTLVLTGPSTSSCLFGYLPRTPPCVDEKFSRFP